MTTAVTPQPSVGRYAPDRYVLEELPEDGRVSWVIRDRRTGELLLSGGEVDSHPWRDGAEQRIRQQRALDSVGR